jgi:NADPH:quinone reductase-like Zn-dependent oxidoreductase
MPQRTVGVKRRLQPWAVMLVLTSCSRTPYTAGAQQEWSNELRPKSLRWAWFGVFNAYGQPDVWARGVAHLVPLIASGAVAPYITGVYTREQAPEAPRLLEGRLSQGKLALVHPN